MEKNKKEPQKVNTTFFTCASGRVIIYCHKRKRVCPYFGSIQCDDHSFGIPKKVHQEMVIMGLADGDPHEEP